MLERGNLARILAFAAFTALLAGCSGSQNASLSSAGGGASYIPAAKIAAPSQASLSAQVGSFSDSHHHDGDDDDGSYTLVTSLAADSSLNFSIWSKGCDATVADAPLFQPASSVSIAQPKATSVNDCTSGAADGATNLYLVVVDVGAASLAPSPIAGPATRASGVLTFDATTNPVKFQGGHSYAFFVASQSASGGDGHHCKSHHDDDNDGHHHGDDGDHGHCSRDGHDH